MLNNVTKNMDCFTNTFKYITALICSAVFSTAFAMEDDILFENEAIPIVLSATKLAQPQTEAPVTITIIDKRLIKASGATQIAEIFRLVPGMQVGYSRGNFPVVAYQGLTSTFPQGVQVVIDGSSVYSPLFGGVIWSMLPIELEDIERIEIVRGPNGTSFGANAYQSVINITTVHAIQQPGLSISARLGNNHSERAFSRISGSNHLVEYRISMSTTKNQGYRNLSDDFSKQHVSSRLDVRLNNTNTLQFNFSAIDSLRETASPVTALLFLDPKRNRNESAQFAQFKWEQDVSPEEQITAQLSYQHFDGKDKYSIPIFPNTLDITGESSRWNMDIEHSFRINQTNRLIWGLGAIYERVYAPFYLNTSQIKSNQRYRIFSNLESRLNPQFILNTGALAEYDQISGNQFSPRIALNYLASPTQSYRISATHAFRTPVITEEHQSRFIGLIELERSAGNLDAETINSFDIGYHGLFLNNRLSADLRYFQNNYDKLINTELSGPVLKILDNQASAHTKGVEFEINYRPNKFTTLHSGYAYTDVNHANNNLNNSVPKHNFNVLLSHQYKQQWQTSVAYYYSSAMQYLGSQNSPQSKFQRLDLIIAKQFKLHSNKELNISLTTQLALDKNIDFHQQATADNRIFLQVEYRAQ